MLVHYFASTLWMRAMYFSETSTDFQRTTPRYIPADKTFFKQFWWK
jgi:hypothetical protein